MAGFFFGVHCPFIKGTWAVPPLATDFYQDFRLNLKEKKKAIQRPAAAALPTAAAAAAAAAARWRSLHLHAGRQQQPSGQNTFGRGTLQTSASMLLVLLCFMMLVGLMVVIKACCQSEFFRGDSPDSSSDSVVQVSVVESTASTPVPYHTNINIIPDVLFERSCRMTSSSSSSGDQHFIDVDFSLPPSYEEAVKMPLPFRSSS
ncbi:hypothetical protein DAPPUDRAFT_220319 [Daphnia pulex]|uniref:Uncharacterized protein n=1 Tax=Daphnia pulex TaxID=6669 RepID=E9FSG1_DAPPU|nr:hypothetical protein DAPPUDRAFT_220319 [Daphnia pulex]|eukprot:EFX89202.1 hypothetical protein DAPPUDRAFT_220319 [Daphnia pulex]